MVQQVNNKSREFFQKKNEYASNKERLEGICTNGTGPAAILEFNLPRIGAF
eukprot:m.682109 g.682109  ORF g.682109 m.682109 type:complete len:51 (-) comp22816_c0_seq7:878-1030(-)